MEIEDFPLSPEEKRQISEPESQFKGVFIPKKIWEDPQLSAIEKCLITQIYYYSKNGEPCFASNAHLAKFLNKSIDRTKHILTTLRKKGYIKDYGYSGGVRKIKVVFNTW